MQTESVVCFWLLVAGAALACGGAQVTPRTSFHADVGHVPPDMQSDYESFAVNCSKCHQLERALAAPVTDTAHWDIYVAKMMRTAGSAIHPDEAPHILRFLYWYTERKGGRRSKQSEQKVAPPPAAAPPEPVSKVPREVTAPESAGDTSQTEGEGTP